MRAVASRLGGKRRQLALIVAGLFAAMLSWGGDANAASRTFSWTDANFVLCEGIGLSGSGTVKVTLEFEAQGGGSKIKRLVLEASYPVQHSASGELSYLTPEGGADSVALVPASSGLSPQGSTSTYLHLRPPGITVANGSPIEISLTTVFTQAGGSCAAGFEEAFSVP